MIHYFSFVGNYEIHICPFMLMWIFHYNSTIPLCLLMGMHVCYLLLLPTCKSTHGPFTWFTLFHLFLFASQTQTIALTNIQILRPWSSLVLLNTWTWHTWLFSFWVHGSCYWHFGRQQCICQPTSHLYSWSHMYMTAWKGKQPL